MESIVRDQIVDHMLANNLFSSKQHDFVPNRNCMTNLLTCLEIWTDMIEKGLPIDIIYTDFAKAFDRVPHQRLLIKMKMLGIAGKTLSWIEAFLSEMCVSGERLLLLEKSQMQDTTGICTGTDTICNIH